MVGAGLGTRKRPRRDTIYEVGRRIEGASAYCPLDHLALSPQCGFATSVLGNALTPDDQWAKLRTVAETAALVWGPPPDGLRGGPSPPLARP